MKHFLCIKVPLLHFPRKLSNVNAAVAVASIEVKINKTFFAADKLSPSKNSLFKGWE
jgi:hypothetical protein